MGRKSSSKSQNREAIPGGPNEPRKPASSTGLVAGIVVVLIAVVGYVVYTKSSAAPDSAGSSAQVTPAPMTPVEPVSAKLGPHIQASLPPLPMQAYAPPRPMETVKAVYKFAAEHPEILSYVPCFCGCEKGGHHDNEDCFVARRDAKGDVVEWEPHGLDCTVCLDVAVQAMQMHASGASVRDIRASVEQKWAGFKGGHTPTADPPKTQ